MKKIDLRISFFLFILGLVGLITLTFSNFTSENENPITNSSQAATSINQQCNTNPQDKCTQGVLSSSQCQFQSDWNSFTISGNPNIGYTNYTNMGPDPRSVKIDSSDGKPFSAGVYVTFNTTPGKTYCASWRWGPNTKSDGVRNSFGRTIGLDPTGGTSAQSSQIIWGNTWSEGGRILDYDLRKDPNDPNIDVKATAQSNTMTIFLRADYNASENSFLLIDMVNVYDEGAGQTVPPTNTPVPPPPTNTPVPQQPTSPPAQPTTPQQPTAPQQAPNSGATWTPVPTWTPAPTWTQSPFNPLNIFNPPPTQVVQQPGSNVQPPANNAPTTVSNTNVNPPQNTQQQPTSAPIDIKSPKELAQEVINPETVTKLSESTDKALSAPKKGFNTVKSYDQKLESAVENWWMEVWISVKGFINKQ